MAAPPRLGATLLLLLLLRAPPPGWGNEGGALGLCKCQRLTSPPGVRLQDLADKVKGFQACGGHLVRFELPRIQICGLGSAHWVVELRRLWEEKEAGRIDARQGGVGPAPKPRNVPLPPMPSTARPPEPHGPTDGPLEPHAPPEPPRPPECPGPTAGPPEPHGPTARPPEPHGPTDTPPELQGLTAGPPESHGPTARPPEPHGPTDRPPELQGLTAGPPESHGPTASPMVEALTTDPVGGPGREPRKGEEAGDAPPPAQPRHYLTAVPVLLGITLVLVGGLTYMICRTRRRPPQGPAPPHRDPGTAMLYYPCELG